MTSALSVMAMPLPLVTPVTVTPSITAPTVVFRSSPVLREPLMATLRIEKLSFRPLASPLPTSTLIP